MNPKKWILRWHATPTTNQTYDFLDGVRGLAILMVVACHLIYMNPDASWKLRFFTGIFHAGSNGVTVFFCLSGFLISLPFWQRKLNGDKVVSRSYATRRFWKIVPPLFLSIVLLTPIYIATYGRADDYTIAAVKWIVGWSWFMPVSGILNPVMWSLIVEVHFYTILPLLFLCCKRLSYKQTLWILFLGFLLIPPIARLVYSWYGIHFSLSPFILVNFPSMLDPFAYGILIAGLFQMGALKHSWARLGPPGLFLLGIIMVISGFSTVSPATAVIFNYEIIRAMVMISSAMILCFIAHPGTAKKWGLELPALRWLGLLSYEWYLLHQPIYFWTKHLLGPSDGNVWIYFLRITIPAVTSLGLAALMYRYFSVPIMRRFRGETQPL